jgi:hypothetical protein
MDQASFFAAPCSSWDNFINNNCPENNTNTIGFMGFDASNEMNGDYFLQTNSMPPYNRGVRGIYYDETLK